MAINTMTEQQYLELRVDDQLRYYSTKSAKYKKYYHVLKTIEIAVSVTIPFLTGYLNNNENVKYVIGILGVSLAFMTSMQILFKYHEKWTTYRSTAESLTQEKFMFLSQSGPYKSDNSLANFTERVETILAKENATWNQLMTKPEEKKQ